MRRRPRLAICARALALVAALLAAACTTSGTVVTYTTYQYALAATTQELHPGQSLPLAWRATPMLVRGEAAPVKGWLCAALAGPYPSVDAIKSSNIETRTCPIQVAGTIVATEAAEADHADGETVTQNLTLPATLAPGYYQLLSLTTHTSARSGGSALSSSIVRIVPKP